MKITAIEVKRLFGMFDHRIELRTEPRITIVHGPNGIGKTSLLNMTAALCEGHWHGLRAIPFSRFWVELDNGQALEVQRLDPDADPIERSALRVKLSKSKKAPIELPGIPSLDELPYLASMLDEMVPELERTGAKSWRNRRTGQWLDWAEVFDMYGASRGLVESSEPNPEWFLDLKRDLQVRLVSTDRLWSEPKRHLRSSRRRTGSGRQLEATVTAFSDELADYIKEALGAYAEKSQQLERSLSRRLIKALSDQAPEVDTHAVISSINELEEKRTRLMDAGLLDPERDFSPLGPSVRLTPAILRVLKLHAEDGSEKLSVFDDLLERVELLTSLINAKYLANKFGVGKSGFKITSRTGRPLTAECLSSGEQHELVLLFGLLFRTPANSLVLIDEPEISLDVNWQRAFLADLIRIAGIGGFDVLAATHSPQVVGRYRSQLLELTER